MLAATRFVLWFIAKYIYINAAFGRYFCFVNFRYRAIIMSIRYVIPVYIKFFLRIILDCYGVIAIIYVIDCNFLRNFAPNTFKFLNKIVYNCYCNHYSKYPRGNLKWMRRF